MQAVAQQGDYCELWNRSPFALQSSPAACTAGKLAPPPPGAVKKLLVFSQPLRVLTKSRKNEALIRNDGVYVISGIFCRANACEKVKARRAEGARTRPKGVRSAGTPRKRSAGAHGGRRQWRKQAVVSPMKQGEPQASLRAQWNDHAELRVGAKRKNAFPSRPLAANRQICKRSGRFVGKPKVCQRFEFTPGALSPGVN